MDDESLVRRFQDGDEASFDELVRRHRRRVHRVARAVLGDPVRADDAAQEAFVKAWKGLRAFDGASRFTTWLHRIAVNAALDLRDAEARKRRVADEAEREPSGPAEPARSPGALTLVLAGERHERLWRAVARLPERQRLTLILRIQHDLTHAEIAEALDCTVGTAKANLHHAVARLRDLLSEEASATETSRTPMAREAGHGARP